MKRSTSVFTRTKGKGGGLHLHLRSQKPRRKHYSIGQERRGMIKNRINIAECPEVALHKSLIGNWEGDTVIGKNNKGALFTLAERKSRYVLAGTIPSKHSDGVTAVVTHLLIPHKELCHTTTTPPKNSHFQHHLVPSSVMMWCRVSAIEAPCF